MPMTVIGIWKGAYYRPTVGLYDSYELSYSDEWVTGTQLCRVVVYRQTSFADIWLTLVFATDFLRENSPWNTLIVS